MYDVIIIGGGPAAVAAGVYVARKQLQSLFIAASIGGQSIVSDDIQNWIGDPHIAGTELAKRFEQHLRQYEGVLELRVGESVTKVEAIACNEDRICDFAVTTESGRYETKTIIVASGARRRRLDVHGEDTFDGRGVSYCSTCDAPLFKGKEVVVVGAGNAGLEAVEDLFVYATKVHLFARSRTVTGDPATFAKLRDNPKLEVHTGVEVLAVLGDKLVSGVRYRESEVGTERELAVGGVFVEIGSVPNSEIVEDLVARDEHGQIKIDSKTSSTSHAGIFAAGDVTDDPFKQNNISAGDGVKAALSAYYYLLKRAKANPAAEAPVDR